MKKLFPVAILVILNTLSLYTIIGWVNFQPSISFLNVGQGNATLIKDRFGNILIDAGRNNGRLIPELYKVLPFYRRGIDIAIITHEDADHYGGYFELLKLQKPQLIIYNGDEKNNESAFMELLSLIKNQRISTFALYAGDSLASHNSKIKILYPSKYDLAVTQDDNARSLVFDVEQSGVSFLLLADSGFTIEQKLLSRSGNLHTNVLQVAHHGSKYATSNEFLGAIKPEIAIISVGKNSYGHPAIETLSRIKQNKVMLLRTDEDGTIEFIGSVYKFHK